MIEFLVVWLAVSIITAIMLLTEIEHEYPEIEKYLESEHCTLLEGQ